ncbi:hypothetical protein [Streptomyces sp. NPDC052701]|uniref:hypothetical protein n=1 Tax=Streptomyces sp. NPDC052701 TaxID=3155533 RepID=UPI003418DEBF
MTWTRNLPAALAAGALVLGGSAGCGLGEAREPGGGVSSSPAGELLGDGDGKGRPYREADEESAPGVGVEVQPGTGGAWEVRLTLRNFRLSPVGAAREAVAGRGFARLYLDGRPVAELRTPEHRLPARLVPRGTHHVTARLYADDGTVWAVDGEPVQSTADITVSERGTEPVSRAEPTPEREAGPAPEPVR